MNFPDENHLDNVCMNAAIFKILVDTIASLLYDNVYTKEEAASNLLKLINATGLYVFDLGGDGVDNVPS